jgi:annexin A7/11
MATVLPKQGFNAQTCEASCKELHDAMKGLGTNEAAIIKVLVAHSNAQRQEIKLKYKTLYGKDLVAELKSELGVKLEDAVIALMTPNVQFLAQELRRAMKGPGTDESVLIEILCRSNEEIRQIRAAYELEYKGRKLEKDVVSETSGHFKRLLVSQCNASRDEDPHVDPAKAEKDAKDIWEAGEAHLGTDESVFNTVLCTRSYPQLKATFEKYRALTGKGIVDTINREMSGTLKEGFLAIVNYCWDPKWYFAERLYKSMKGLGTDDATLIRVIVTRSEIDLKDVSKSFHKQYSKFLADFIKGDCSGDYGRLLLAILGNN